MDIFGRKKSSMLNVKVITVEAEMEFNVAKDTTGGLLLKQVADAMGLREIWYFGLRFIDSHGNEAWIKHKKKIVAHDIAKANPLELHFLARIYPEDVAEEIIQTVTQRLFYLQIRNSILTGEIYCPPETCVLLASFACQARFGDFKEEMMEDKSSVLYQTPMFPERVIAQHDLTKEEWIEKVIPWYKENAGMLREEARLEYLNVAQGLEMCFVTFFDIKNKKNTDLLLGVEPVGVNIYQTDNKLAASIGFPWSEIKQFDVSGKRFTIRAVDKNAQNFVFFSKPHVNRLIFSLCLINHSMYIRRRGPDSLEIQQMKKQAQEEKQSKTDMRNRMQQEKQEREDIEKRLANMEELYKETTQHNVEIQRQVDEYERKVKELENALRQSDKQKEELSLMHSKLRENVEALELAKANVTDDMEKLQEENARIQQQISVKNVEIEQSNYVLSERQQELQRLKEERESLELRARQLEEERLQREASVDDNKDITEEVDVLVNGDDRREEQRTTVVSANPELDHQLKSLANDLSAKRFEDKMERMDYVHEENRKVGRTKYQTLRKIREGNTRKRVEQYEAL